MVAVAAHSAVSAGQAATVGSAVGVSAEARVVVQEAAATRVTATAAAPVAVRMAAEWLASDSAQQEAVTTEAETTEADTASENEYGSASDYAQGNYYLGLIPQGMALTPAAPFPLQTTGSSSLGSDESSVDANILSLTYLPEGMTQTPIMNPRLVLPPPRPRSRSTQVGAETAEVATQTDKEENESKDSASAKG